MDNTLLSILLPLHTTLPFIISLNCCAVALTKKFAKNKKSQISDLRKYVKNFKSKKNLVLVTHYVVISEALNYAPSSGEIVISDKKFNIIGTFKTNY